MTDIIIRNACEDDAGIILDFVTALAKYEKAEHEVVATESGLRLSIFNRDTTTHALICEVEGRPIGFAVYFFNYSTWLGKNGLYLEDLYVSPESRGVGAGTAILKYLARLAIENECGRFEWNVLDWNESAIDFYKSIGAEELPEWVNYRLAGENLEMFAKD